MEEKNQQLLAILKAKSFRYRADPPFKLASGKESPYYVDCKPTTNNAQGMALIGEIIFDLIRNDEVQAIGGLTMGADPIAHAVAMISYQKGKPINAFSVRKKPKDHGNIKAHRIEGDISPGQNVIIIEDVITTGGSTLQAIEAAREFGLNVIKVVALLDREEGGRQNIEKQDTPVHALFTLSQFTATL